MRDLINKFKSNKNNKEKSLLVLVSDGFGLLACVVTNHLANVSITASARSNHSEPHDALVEVIEKLSSSFGRLPSETIMLHTHAVPANLELGIENLDALAQEKMQELVRWEMESIYSDLIPSDNLGWLMIGMGFINEQQRDELVEYLEIENQDALKKVRIGELAIQRGLINRDQLEECLKQQDILQLQDQRIECGWNRLDEQEQPLWLATAVSHAVHKKWVDALEQIIKRSKGVKTRLKYFYPFIGTSAIHIPEINTAKDIYFLELHRPYLCLLHYHEGRLIQCINQQASSDTPRANDVESLFHLARIPENSDVYVNITFSERKVVFEEIKYVSMFNLKSLENNVPFLANYPDEIALSEAIIVTGAMNNYIVNSQELIVPVQGQKPPPPFYQRPEAKVAAIVFAIASVFICIESVLAYKMNKLDKELSLLKEQVKKQELVRKDVRNATKAQENLDLLTVEYDDVINNKKLIESVLVSRQKFTRQVLDIVINNLNDNLLINNIEELEWNKFVIEGWAVDQPSIDYFSEGLSRSLQNWDMYISENPSELARNNNGYTGYSFRFVIQKNLPVTSSTLPVTANRSGVR
jgi:hypothetical protein